MRQFGKIMSSVWHSDKFRSCGPISKLIYFYFHSNAHGNSIGCYRIPKLYMLADLDLDEGMIKGAVQELVRAELIEWDASEQSVRIVRFLVMSPPQNPKHRLGIETLIKEVTNGPWRQALYRELRLTAKLPPKERIESKDKSDRVSIRYGDGIHSVSHKTKTQTQTETQTERDSPKSEPTPNIVATASRSRPPVSSRYPQAFEIFWSAWRTKPRAPNDSKAEGFQAWKTHCSVVDIEAVLQGVQRYKASANVKQGYHQAAARWLRGRGWEDDYDTTNPVQPDPDPKRGGFVG